MLINIKAILNASIKSASCKIDCIFVLTLGLCSSGSTYICTVVLLVWLPDSITTTIQSILQLANLILALKIVLMFISTECIDF
jgi:hypothetical protein